MKNTLVFRFLIILLAILGVETISAQELNCNVSVASPQISGTDKEVFNTLQTAIREFMNNKKWTNNVYKVEERIECSILITISDRPSTEQFKGSIQIQARRPVYGTSYSTTMFNFIDKDLDFTYLQSQPFEWSENTHLSNLTSTLAYYAYIILGIDYDSFSMNGGSVYFDKALGIVNAAQNAQEKGWKSFESQKNRYWLAENLTNSNYGPIHDFIYKYHRLGLDVMGDKTDQGRTVIVQCVDNLLKLKRSNPNIFFFQALFTSKSDELVNLFSGPNANTDKAAISKSLIELDPANAGKYKKITETK